MLIIIVLMYINGLITYPPVTLIFSIGLNYYKRKDDDRFGPYNGINLTLSIFLLD
jgi:hypothetical protein